MRLVEERLRGSDEGFPAHAVDPSSSIDRVVRRGRIRLALARAGTGLATVAVVAAGVVAVPQLVGPPSPEVVSPVIDPSDEAPAVERDEPAREQGASKIDRGEPSDLAFVPDRPVKEEVVHGEPAPEEQSGQPVVVKDPAPQPQPQPKPKPKTEEPAPATEFTANQWQTHVEHDPPYNKYHGTAAPGTEIRAGNGYGSASGVADAKGNWYVKVWFEDAPYGTHTFTVVVETSDGHRRTFGMTATRPEAGPKVAFTANQKHASSDAEPPANRYWGTAQPHTQVSVMSEYGGAETTADAEGHWEVAVTFDPAPAGTKTFLVKARSLATGEYVKFEMTTHREGSSSEQVAFTANQKHRSSDAEPPANVYWGTAQPDTQVSVISEYGSVETIADADGNWEAHLAFEKAPAGTTTFTVKVRSLATGEYVKFEMTTHR